MSASTLIRVLYPGIIILTLAVCPGPTRAATATATVMDTASPTVPGNLRTMVSPFASEIAISWDASTDDVAVTGYRVFRDDAMLTAVTSTTFTDRSVSENTIYRYSIQAFDAAGNAASSETLAVNSSPIADTNAPGQPTNIRDVVLTNAQAGIAWDPPAGKDGIVGYNVYRNTTLLATTIMASYTDDSVTAGSAYTYTVVTVDRYGNYAVSEPFELIIPPLTDKTAVISWRDPNRNEDGSCNPGIEHVRLYYGDASGDYSRDEDINLAIEQAWCTQEGYSDTCNKSVLSCKYRTAELGANTWYMAFTAQDRLGLTSSLSKEIVVQIK